MNNLPEKLQKIVKEVDQQIAPKLVEIEDQIVYNTAKVLAAYQANDVAEADLNGANGYGDDDMGRDKLDKIYAQVFQTEDAVVRPQFVSGTHTLFVALAGNLKYGDTLTYLTGQPYDTLQKVIDLPITHISAYGLICEPNTPLTRAIEQHKLSLPSDDEAVEMYDYTVDFLAKHANY